MKNLFVLSIAMLTASSHINHIKSLPVAKLSIIEGHVSNRQAHPESQTILIQATDISGFSGSSYTGIINKDGDFKINLYQYVAQDIKLKQEGISMQPIIKDLIVHPGEKIHINLDFKTITNISFSGDADKTNNDLYNYTTNYADYRTRYETGRLYDIHDPEQFKAANAKIKQEMINQSNEFTDKVHPSEEVKTWIKNDITINYYLTLSGFMFKYNRVLTNNQVLGMDYVNIVRDDINEIYNTTLLNGDSYLLLGSLMPAHKNEDLLSRYDPNLIAEINNVAKENNNPLLRQLLIGASLRTTLGQTNTGDFYKNKDVLDLITEPFIKDPLIKRYNLVANNVKQYQKGVFSMAKNIIGTPIEKVFDDIKRQNKGKVVYVDIWATWCSACIAEMPKSEKMNEKYKDKNVTFAYLCVSSKKELWKTRVPELKVTGTQIFCDDKQSKSIHDVLKVHGIPFYILINKDGDIIEASNDLRPGEFLTMRKIDNLLE